MFLTGRTRPSRVFNAELTLIGVHKLTFKLHPQLELDLFEGAIKRESESSRRDYLAALIEEHRLNQGDTLSSNSTILNLGPTIRRRSTNKDLWDTETSPLSGDPNLQTTRRRRRVIGGSEDQSSVLGSLRPETSNRIPQANYAPSDDDSESRSSKRVRRGGFRTVLRVSSSDNPARALVNILFTGCNDIQALFRKVIVEGGIKEFPFRAVLEMSATFTWNGRGHLLRNDDESDWGFFTRESSLHIHP